MRYFFEDKKNEIESGISANLDCPAHLHEHIEFGYVLSGSSDIFVDDKLYKLNVGDVFIVFPNQIHRYENSKNLTSYLTIFSSDYLPEFKKTFMNKIPQSPVITENTLHILKLFDIFFDKNVNLSVQAQRGIILATAGIAIQNLTLVNQDKYNISTVKNMLIFCNSHYSEPITISDVADHLHISRSHAAHIFQNKLNTSFSQYINDKRMTLACDILKNTHMSVTEVAFSSGFSSLRTFNRIFSKYMGCSPREYRINSTS